MKSDAVDAPKFLSKKQREELKAKQDQEEKLKEEQRLKDLEKKRLDLLSAPIQKSTNDQRDRDHHRRQKSRSRSRSRDRRDGRRADKHREPSEREGKYRNRREDEVEFEKPKDRVSEADPSKKYLIEEKEVEMIRGKYMGVIKDKKKVPKPGDKFKKVFVFEWDASEDTSQDINPLYAKIDIELKMSMLFCDEWYKKHDPKLLFGKGFMAGVDQSEQQKQYDSKSTSIKTRPDSKIDDHQDIMTNPEYKPKDQISDRDWRIFRENNDIMVKGSRIPFPVRNWDEIEGLNETLRDNISVSGFAKPMPIQMQGIPVGMSFRDMIGLAPTGSGKSAAFLIPLINFLMKMPPIKDELIQDGPYSIIMAPTRELAIQIEEEFKKLVRDSHLRSIQVVGGKSSEEQGGSIGRGVEVVIGTPGRIEDLIKRQYLVLNQCYYVILDEADKMIDLELEESVNYILESIPPQLQKSSEKEKDVAEQEQQMMRGEKFYKTFVMFSATMLPQIEKIARKYLRYPAMVHIGEPGGGKKDIDQRVEFVTEGSKKQKLVQLLQKHPQPPILIFVRERVDTESLASYLAKVGFNAATLHGSKTQDQREKALKSLKDGVNDILVCTNVAARGLDVEGVSHVINYHAPSNIVDYIHRIGRTGRAGRKGMATTFITNADDGLLYDLKKFMQDNDQIIPSELANHPAARFKGGFQAITADGAPTVGQAQKKPEYGGRAVPTSTQMNKGNF